MNKSDYDKYYKQGGTYELPIEVFNELMDRLEEQEDMLSKYRHLQTTGIDELMGENKRLNKARKTDIEYNKYLQKEIIRLNNIINELERLNKENEELKHKLKLINSYVYGCDIDSLGVDKE